MATSMEAPLKDRYLHALEHDLLKIYAKTIEKGDPSARDIIVEIEKQIEASAGSNLTGDVAREYTASLELAQCNQISFFMDAFVKAVGDESDVITLRSREGRISGENSGTSLEHIFKTFQARMKISSEIGVQLWDLIKLRYVETYIGQLEINTGVSVWEQPQAMDLLEVLWGERCFSEKF